MAALVTLIFGFATAIGALAADKLPTERSRSSTLDKIKFHIGSKTFAAALYDNPTVTKLKAMLPLTLEMSDERAKRKREVFPFSYQASVGC